MKHANEAELVRVEVKTRESLRRFAREVIEELRFKRSAKYLHLSDVKFEELVGEAIAKVDRRFLL